MTKKINITFDIKSLKNAIKELKSIQTKMRVDIPNKFLNRCLDEIIIRANNYLEQIPIDYRVTSNIMGSWHKTVTGNSATLINDADKAVFIEFGVGAVGQDEPHPNASETNYKYNVQPGFKLPDDSWIFKLDNELGSDIMDKYVLHIWDTFTDTTFIQTEGQPAQLYLYNAIMDMSAQNIYQKIWNEVLEENLYKEK